MADDKKPTVEELEKQLADKDKALKEAHEAIAEAESKAVEAPVFTANVLDEEDKKTKKVKVKLVVAKSIYPKARHNHIEVTAEVLKEDPDLVDELYAKGFGGFEEIVESKEK